MTIKSLTDETDHDRRGSTSEQPRCRAERRGRAMGTSIHLVVEGPEASDLADTAVTLIADLERRWSRFDPCSEVSEMNRRSGELVAVSPATIELVNRGVTAWHLTGGKFDPTVHDDMIAMGYDRSFDDLDTHLGDNTSIKPVRRTRIGLTEACPHIEIDAELGRVRLPVGVGFDPGGIGKGLAADRVTAELIELGAQSVLVNLGGDLRVRGRRVNGEPWIIRIGEPAIRPEPFATIAITEGAIATSTTERRRWADRSGHVHHHVVDPTTGQPHRESPSDVVLASAVAGAGWWAEAAATASIGNLGASLRHDLLNVQTLRVSADGVVHRSVGFGTYER